MNELLKVYPSGDCGDDGYPFVWHEVVKDLIREAAGHRCVRCHHPFVVGETPGEWSPCDKQCDHAGPVRWRSAFTGEWHEDRNRFAEGLSVKGVELMLLGKEISALEAKWRVLTVHHLTGEKADLRWWNLAALCQRCHLSIQTRVDMAQIYAHEHSEWFKPFAAGYYAATYLGEDLTREETEGRLDELLALELAA